MSRISNIISDYKIDLRILREGLNKGHIDENQYQISKKYLTEKFLDEMADHVIKAHFVIEDMESKLSKDDEFRRRLLNI